MVHLRRKLGGGGPVGHSPKPPTPKGAGAAEGAARVASPHSTVDTQGDANHIVVSCPTTGPPPAPAMGAPPCSPPLPLLQQEWGAAPCPSNKLGGGGGSILNVGPVVAWEGGEVTPHPVNKRQSLNESTNRSLSAICVWAEGGQRESMQRAEGGGGGNSCPSPPAPGAAPWGSSSCTTPMPTGLGVLPVPCAGGDVGWCTRAQRDGAKQRGWGWP